MISWFVRILVIWVLSSVPIGILTGQILKELGKNDG